MVKFTLGYLLKKIKVTQVMFLERLHSKYGLKLSQSNFNVYCGKEIAGDTKKWMTIRKCAEEEYGIIFNGYMWQYKE